MARRMRLGGTFMALAAACAISASCSSGAMPAPVDRAASSVHPVDPSTTAGSPTPAKSVAPPAPLPMLPRGGRTIFPAFRVVAYYGAAGSPGLGVLGNGTPEQAAGAVEQQAEQYAFAGRPVLPALELITTVALSSPGPDGIYSSRGDPQAVATYLAAARQRKELLVLDFQPGQGEFLPQIKRFERFLTQPDVGVAVDPEWHMKPGEIPGRVFGSASAQSLNDVSAYLAGLVARYRLPQKLFVIHQFRPSMLPDRDAIVARPGLATVFHADGNGTEHDKLKVYNLLHFPGPPFARGFKLFFTRDTPLLSPAQVMAIQPAPDLVTYQ